MKHTHDTLREHGLGKGPWGWVNAGGSTNNSIVAFLKRCPCTLHGPRKAAVAAATIHPNVEKVFKTQ